MKNHCDLFYRWMKNNLSEKPSSQLDKNILAMAEKELGAGAQSPSLIQWLKPGLTLAFGITLVIAVNIYTNRRNESGKIIMTEAPEMVLHYKEIELMADASALSEEDWKKIEGTK